MENPNKIVTLDNFSPEEKLKIFLQLQAELESGNDGVKEPEINGNLIRAGNMPEQTDSDNTADTYDTDNADDTDDNTSETKYDDVIDIDGGDCIEPLPIHVTKNNVLMFTLYYNPVNPAIFLYLDEIQRLTKIKTRDKSEIIPTVRKINEFIDAVFGEGSANIIYRHDNINRTLLTAVLDKLRNGYEEYSKTAGNAENISQSAKIIEAKKQAAQFRPPVSRR